MICVGCALWMHFKEKQKHRFSWKSILYSYIFLWEETVLWHPVKVFSLFYYHFHVLMMVIASKKHCNFSNYSDFFRTILISEYFDLYQIKHQSSISYSCPRGFSESIVKVLPWSILIQWHALFLEQYLFKGEKLKTTVLPCFCI